MPTKGTFKRDVAHPLTGEEVLARYDSAQHLDDEATALEEKLKEDTKDRKDAVKKLRAQARRHRDAAAQRSELRSVECKEVIEGWQVKVVRLDTGEVVDEYANNGDGEQTGFAGLAPSSAEDLPLEPDHSPGKRAPKAPSERPSKKAKSKGKR